MEHELAIPGSGPFTLPCAQNIRLDVADGAVILVARVLAQGRPDLVSIGIPMTTTVATDLLIRLPQAIDLALKGEHKNAEEIFS
ncbi:MAG: hypothetical protein WB662_09015 [Methyloceanibacter sp.]